MTETIEADVIVIGSGVAGAMTAYKLAQNGVKVAILEAGPRIDRATIVKNFTQTAKLDLSSGYPNEDWAPRPDWQGEDKPYFEHTGSHPARIEYLRVLGGTTWHWSGSALRLLPVDFKLNSTYGVGRDWPFPYEVLEKFYCEAEKEMGVAGDNNAKDGAPKTAPYPLPPIPLSYADKIIAEGMKKIGLHGDVGAAARNSLAYDGRSQCMGFGTCSPVCPSGAQYGAIHHVKKCEKLGVRVFENTRVDLIVAGADGKIAEIHAKRNDGSEVVAKGRIFLLAANGIESPRLLLMGANENFPKGLANSSGAVGRNFFEHPGLVCRIEMPEDVYPRGPQETMVSHFYRDGEFRKKHSSWHIGVHNSTSIHETTNELLVKGVEPPALDAAIRKGVLRQLSVNTQMEQVPEFDRGITLDWNRRDRAGQPMMLVKYSLSAYEQAAFDHARGIIKKLAAALDAKLLTAIDPLVHHHPMGMLIMGKDPKNSVVDAECRSHDHKNLFVVGGAVMPAGGTVSPTLTIAALAIRAAQDIAKQLKT